MKRALLLLALTATTWRPVFADSTGAPASAPPSTPAVASPLLELNGRFRKIYADAKLAELQRLGPVVVADGDALKLERHGKIVASATIKPVLYHYLKAMCHLPLALFVMLHADTDKPLLPSRVEELQSLRAPLAALSSALPTCGFSAVQLERERAIANACTRFVDGAISERRVTSATLSAFIRHVTPPVMDNADDAARVELDALSETMRDWRHLMTPQEWRTFYVILTGGHMARQLELSQLYFCRLLNEGEGHRIVFAEVPTDEKQAYDLLGTHVLDYDIGCAFFGDGLRMHRDLLSSAALRYLDRMIIER